MCWYPVGSVFAIQTEKHKQCAMHVVSIPLSTLTHKLFFSEI